MVENRRDDVQCRILAKYVNEMKRADKTKHTLIVRKDTTSITLKKAVRRPVCTVTSTLISTENNSERWCVLRMIRSTTVSVAVIPVFFPF